MMLALDAGNSRIKWGVHDGRGWLAQGVSGHDELDSLIHALRAFPDISRAIISNVAGTAMGARLQSLLDEAGIAAHWLQATAQACGVSNGYSTPSQLGSDRWAALVAAWNRQRRACVVACAGTALTIDALSARGEFVGGLILPGLALMQGALHANTAGLAGAEGGRFCTFPQNTRDAMLSGALQGMAGAIERMQHELAARESGQPALLLAGGDAAALKSRLSAGCEIVDNLVLEGLVLLAGELAE